MIGPLTKSQMEALLHQQVVGHIACHHENFIYLVPTSYAYDGEFIYAHSHEGTKLNIMRKNPNICFEVDDVTDMSNWQSVIVWGRFEELTFEEERIKALRVLLHRKLPLNSSTTTHLGKEWPFSENEPNEISGVVYKIVIDRQTGRFESNSLSPDSP